VHVLVSWLSTQANYPEYFIEHAHDYVCIDLFGLREPWAQIACRAGKFTSGAPDNAPDGAFPHAYSDKWTSWGNRSTC